MIETRLAEIESRCQKATKVWKDAPSYDDKTTVKEALPHLLMTVNTSVPLATRDIPKLIKALRAVINQRNDALDLAWDECIPTHVIEDNNKEIEECLK